MKQIESAKRVAKVKLTLTKRTVEGGLRAPNKRVVASGGDPAAERADARSLPTLGEVFDDYIESGKDRADVTQRSYRRYANLYLGDWRPRPIDGITRRDVESRFHLLTERHGAVPANQALSFLRSVYRRPCVDHDGLRNPVEQWFAGGGRYHPHRRRKFGRRPERCPIGPGGLRHMERRLGTRGALNSTGMALSTHRCWGYCSGRFLGFLASSGTDYRTRRR